MIKNFAKIFTQANTFHWEIFPLSTKFEASFSMLKNYFPLENILQASKTFVLFICSRY